MLTNKQLSMLNDAECIISFPMVIRICGHVTVSTLIASCESQDIVVESIVDAYSAGADILDTNEYSLLCSLYKPGERVETVELSEVLALRNM